ncbi:serine/threonine-protein kinase [Mangrovimicrobium sediminis]|nr:serine/threonine-protein kinase [Haliea sp. SAOS-164]
MNETRIGPYSILRLLRQGGQGRVFLGYDRRLQRQAAIKIHNLPRSWSARRELLGEARRASGINDARVVQIYDLLESRKHLAIVMEYVPGCDLEQLLQRTRLSLPSVLRIATDLAAALAAATQEGVVHGDIKAGNVLITSSGRAKLADFGIARRTEQAGADSGAELPGSPTALAPELLQGSAPDLRSDLFAFGCLVYRMLTGMHPFCPAGQLDSELLLHGEPRPVQDNGPVGEELPPDLLTLLGELLQKDPLRRPQDTHRVRSLLRTATRDIPLSRLDSLAGEAAPWFRPESSEDIPPHIPSDLRHRGRSRLVRKGMELWIQRFSALRLSTRLVIIASVPLVLFAMVDALTSTDPLRVHFEVPSIAYSTVRGMPREANASWVMQVVYDTIESRVGTVHASGAVLPRAYYADLEKVPPDEVIDTSLQCDEMLCVLLVSRNGEAGYVYQQAMFAPQLPLPAWEETLTRSVAALFP